MKKEIKEILNDKRFNRAINLMIDRISIEYLHNPCDELNPYVNKDKEQRQKYLEVILKQLKKQGFNEINTIEEFDEKHYCFFWLNNVTDKWFIKILADNGAMIVDLKLSSDEKYTSPLLIINDLKNNEIMRATAAELLLPD